MEGYVSEAKLVVEGYQMFMQYASGKLSDAVLSVKGLPMKGPVTHMQDTWQCCQLFHHRKGSFRYVARQTVQIVNECTQYDQHESKNRHIACRKTVASSKGMPVSH